MKKIFALWFSLTVLLAACKDDNGGTTPTPDDDDPGNPTLTEMLAGSWNIIALEIDGISRNISSQDQAEFADDGTYTLTLPELDFFPNEGSWEIDEPDFTLAIIDTDYEFDIDTLTASDMVLILEYDNFKAESIIYRLTFEKI